MTKHVPGAKRGRPRPDEGPLRKISLEVDPRVLKRFDRWVAQRGLSRGAAIRQIMTELTTPKQQSIGDYIDETADAFD